LVKFLPSSAQRSIQILVAEVGTTLTISAPPQAVQGQPFAVSGILYRNDTQYPLVNMDVTLRYNGQPLGSAKTGVDGDYLFSVSIPTPGTFTLIAEFAGAEVAGLFFGPSSARAIMGLEGEVSPLMLGVLLVGGYLLLKKR